jgi:hypothetical protein
MCGQILRYQYCPQKIERCGGLPDGKNFKICHKNEQAFQMHMNLMMDG